MTAAPIVLHPLTPKNCPLLWLYVEAKRDGRTKQAATCRRQLLARYGSRGQDGIDTVLAGLFRNRLSIMEGFQ